jgi:hypothetical protein
MARVVRPETPAARGALSIAGALIEAELPKDVKAGQDIRLIVKEVTPERVVLTLADPSAVAPAPAPVQLPGGGAIRITDDEQSGGQGSGGESRTLALRYDAPTLGAVEFRLLLDPASLRVAVELPAGDSFDRAQAAAADLRDALSAAVDRPVSVTVSARRDPVDVYA